MALDPYIARGATPVGGDIPNILQQQRENEQRNALFQAQQGNIYAQQQNTRAQRQLDEEKFAAEQETAVAKQRALQAQYVLASPNPKALAAQAFPQLAQQMGEQQWAAATDDDVRKMFEVTMAQLGPMAGMEPPKPKEPTYRTAGDAIVELGPNGAREVYRAPQRAQQAPAEMYSPVDLDDGTIGAFDRRTGQVRDTGRKAGGKASVARPLPIGALRLVDEAQQAINASGESLALVDRALATVEGGNVSLGLASNAISRGRNAMGASSDNSRAFADIKQTLEKLRNNYLLLAKGVQTEGDAQRAWNSEIGESVQNDNRLAAQQLKKAKAMLERAVASQNVRIETVYSNFGQEAPAKAAPQASQAPSQPPREAPPSAVEFLKANPQTAPAFKAKYGYLP